MAKAKTTDQQQLSAEQLLVARVDAMMDPRAAASPEPTSAPILPGKAKAAPAPIITPPIAPEPTEVESVESTDGIEIKPSTIDTPQSDAAIADIVAQEADEVLAAEDAGVAAAALAAENQSQTATKRGHPVFWFFILLMAILAIIFTILLLVPSVSFAP